MRRLHVASRLVFHACDGVSSGSMRSMLLLMWFGGIVGGRGVSASLFPAIFAYFNLSCCYVVWTSIDHPQID
jgi:hypothetical protein